MKRIKVLIASIVMVAGTVMAQDMPVFHKYSFDDSAIINGMSDNGKYVVANGLSADNSLLKKGARLIEVDTDKVTDLAANYTTNDYISMGTADVSDDGSIVVGTFDQKPAYWSKSTGKWTILPREEEEYFGDVRSVTPDGKYAVGMQSIDQDGFYTLPTMWDLTTNTIVELDGIPYKDLSGQNQDQNWFDHISADGNFILGCMSYSYVGSTLFYIYDVKNSTYSPIGYKLENNRFTPLAENLFFINSAVFSPDAKWVSGRAYMVTSETEYETTYVLDVTTGEFTVYTATEDVDVVASSVDNNGHAFGATPSGNPIREWSVRSGAYWYSFDQILKQQYNYDFYARTGYDNTGTPICVSSDGRRVVAFPDPYNSYVVELPITFAEACKGVDLLGAFHTSPKAGSTVSRLGEVTITFDRDVQLMGKNNCAEIRDAQGNTVYNSAGITINKKKVTIRFRNGALNEGEKYTLHIPAGSIALLSDATLGNKEINVEYNGRANKPVEVATVYPAPGTAFAKIDNSTNPIVLTYDVEVVLPDSAKAYLYNENETEAIATLLMAYSGNTVAVFPATTQYLFKDNNYRVEIMPGSVTDVAGNGASEKYVINYKGSYEREISFDDNSLLIENFNTVGVANFMLWDGDRLNPNETAQAIGFDRNDYGWAIVWDENDVNIAASSHSMYNPAGKSDDWMVVPQLYIPDDNCSLKFLSQSFLSGKEDYLKVYIWSNDEVVNALDDAITARIKSEGTLVYNELQSPGSDDNLLAGDWTENTVSLADFAGKNIYIAFLNDNENQSAVFVDDVQVSHDKPVRVAFTNAPSVIKQESILIEGVLSIDTEEEVYQSLSLTLKDSEGNEVDNITETGLNLKKGDTYKFAFDTPLPLTEGIVNEFTVTALCNDTRYELVGEVSNLAFKPVKRIVLEEFSGRMCSNCPLGVVAIEHLLERYGDLFIPICIRTYGDDPLGTGLSDYTSFLGLAAAPSGVINRKYMSMPAASYNGGYYFSNQSLPEGSDKLWADVVAEELEIPAVADINITNLSVDNATNEFVIPLSVSYALNAENLNLNLFTVIMEDYVLGWQINGFASVEDPALGEWGKGGLYGVNPVYDYPNMDVCRAYDGLTFNGTGGYFPQMMIAGEEYEAELRVTVPANIEKLSNTKVAVMLIDANTGLVINAAMANEIAAVENIDSDSNTTVGTLNGKVVVTTAEEARVEVYGINGMLIATATGNGNITLDTPAGVAIVKVVTDSDVIVKKILVK